MASSIPPSRQINRLVKSCTQCKQVKLRCDSKAKFPTPCTRCQMKGLHCIIDSTFRRTPARKRVEDMARELETLKNQKGEDKLTASPSEGHTMQSSSSPENFIDTIGTAYFDYAGLELDTFQLAGIAVSNEDIIEIWKVFAELFYPHLPILEPTTSISSLYQSSPFFFWTVIIIVLGRYVFSSRIELFKQLEEPYMNMLRINILGAPLPLLTVQALLYMVTYPLPTSRQIREPSWLYSGIALNAALYMGLHQAKPLQSLRSIGVVPGPIRARAYTWLGCFLTNTSLSLFTGLPPSISSRTELDATERFIREHQIPREFAHQIMVQHTLAKFTSVVLNDPNGSVSYSLIQLVDGELDGLRSRFPSEWTSRVEVNVLIAKLHLYAMSVVRLHADRTSRDVLLKLGFPVALRIVYLTEQGLHYKSTDPQSLGTTAMSRTLPKEYFRGIVLAAVFLLRYFALNERAIKEEQELARNHVAIVHSFFKAGVLAPGDEYDRATKFFELLSRSQPVDIDNVKLKVDNRLGQSLVYDAMSTTHSMRNISLGAEEVEQERTLASGLEQNPIAQTDGLGQFGLNFDATMMEGLGPIDMSLPIDIWGDNPWDMIDVGFPLPHY